MSLADLRGVLRFVPCLAAAGGSTAGTTGVLPPGFRALPLRPPEIAFAAGELTPVSATGAIPELFPALGLAAMVPEGTRTEEAPDLKYCHIASALAELIVSRNALWVV